MTATATAPQIRERVLQLAREVDEFSRSDVPPEIFFREFLRRLITAVGAEAGAVWLVDDSNRLSLAHEVRLAETGFFAEPQAMQRNQALLNEALQNGQSRCLNPADPTSVELPTDHQLIVAALQSGTKPIGVVEVFQRPDSPQGARLGYLQYVEQMAGFATRYLERRQKPKETDGPSPLLDDFARLVLDLQRSLKVAEVASTAANDGRLFLKCDRVSVAIARGKKMVVQAVTGQESINRRANLVRSMSALARQVVATGEPLVFTGKDDDLPPPIEKPLAHFVQESGSRMVIIVPLLEPEPLVARDDDAKETRKKKAARKPRPLGCLIVEQFTESEPVPGLRQRIDLIADHVATALYNARAHQRIFLLGFWQALGRGLEWFYGRKLMKTAAVLALVAAIGASLALIPWDYRVEGEGKLMPVVQHEVFAPLDGEVQEILVQGGQRVKKGDLLLRLRNDELRTQLVQAQSRLNVQTQAAASLRQRIADASRNGQPQERTNLEGQLFETLAEITGLQEHVQVLERRLADLEVHAPIDGVVATFQLEQLLRNRPVQRGEVLLEVMDDTGPWRLELEVEEHRMGHLLRGRQKLGTEQLPVEFILATAPEHTYQSALQELATRSNESAENGAIVEAFCSIDPRYLPPNRRIGAEVRAKINCGERSLGYVLFGDVVEFVQKHLWL